MAYTDTIIDPNTLDDLSDNVVFINRVAKVVKGGKRFSFSALVVVGDKNGHVGYGLGKANEVPEAIRKGNEKARKNLFKVPLVGTTIPHRVNGHHGAGKVMLRPASPGTGVIAGGAMRAILEAAGVKDVLAKIVGTTTPHNVLNATADALKQLQNSKMVSARRGKEVIGDTYEVPEEAAGIAVPGADVANVTEAEVTGEAKPKAEAKAEAPAEAPAAAPAAAEESE